nr:phosphatase PAP2 family protein [Novosphingobium panipatense]
MTMMEPVLSPSALSEAGRLVDAPRLRRREADAERPGRAIRRHFLIALGFSLAAVWLLLDRADLHIDPWRADNLPFYAAGMAALVLRIGWGGRSPRRPPSTAAEFSEYAALFTLVSLMGAAASYPVAALTHGYADAALQDIDEVLGFDWLACYRLVAAHPVLQVLGTIAYRSIYVTPAMILWAAARRGDRQQAYRFLAGFWLAAVITLVLFSLMPAVGPFSYLWHQPVAYMPESELWQQGLIPTLRERSVHLVDLGHLRGIVSAPSFHTAAAVLYIATAWPVRGLRWPVLALNLAMLFSTPVEGTHYLIDMVLGAGVAVTALLVVAGYCRRLERQPGI